MAEPVPLDLWVQQEAGLAWIPAALAMGKAAQRQRAVRARQALECCLRRLLAQGRDRGRVRHRFLRYLLHVRSHGEGLRVRTLARSLARQSEQPLR
ncbi:MAG: hypothetical protein ACUVX9_03215 [Anaerolineae bacterium]